MLYSENITWRSEQDRSSSLEKEERRKIVTKTEEMAEAAKFLNMPSLDLLDLSVGRYNKFKQWKTKWKDYEVLTDLKAKTV